MSRARGRRIRRALSGGPLRGAVLVAAALAVAGVVAGTPTSRATPMKTAAGEPTNVTLPQISGTAQVGQTLTTDPGTWTNSPTSYGYEWLRCNSGGGSCVAISGATASTYLVVRDDLGKTMRVRVVASNAAGSSAPATSNKTAKVAGTLPQNTSPPTFSPTTGLVAGATTVTVTSNGTWTAVPVPSQWAYQWQRCLSQGDPSTCADIAGATATSYALTAADVGSYIRLGVQATNVCSSGCGSTWAYSAISGEPVGAAGSGPPVNTGLPTISGTAQVGQTLTASPGSWTNGPTSYAYQWKQCDSSGGNCVAISGATLSTYVLQRADLGKTVRVSVTASNDAGTSAPATSTQTARVAGVLPQNTSPPTFSPTGGLAAGSTTVTLTSNGTWTGVPVPTQWAYQWQRCAAQGDPSTCANIAGATATSYALSSADAGRFIRLGVRATNVCSTGCGSTWAYSAPSAEPVVGAPPGNTTAPTISGTPQMGQTLTADPGTWTNYPTAYAYQWFRCDSTGVDCLELAGATAGTYTPVQDDVGSRLLVRVTATNGIGSGSADSAPTEPIAPNAPPPTNESPPTISGTAEEGQTLTAENGVWASADPITYSYAWQRCSYAATVCAPITGATQSTYTLGEADVGARVQVVVTATNLGGSAQASSDPTDAVRALPPPGGDPVIAAVGDIACDPANEDFNGGFGNAVECRQLWTSNLVLQRPVAAVLPLGDTQYECGGYQAFLDSYDPSWGRFKSITYPSIGNHEYYTLGGATDCDPAGQAAGYFTYFGAAAGDPAKGYYSYEVGGWRLIALNSNCSKSGGCYSGSIQERWLRDELAAHPATCTLAYWHHPRFSSVTSSSAVAPYFSDMVNAGGELVLTGHMHHYERLAPQSGFGAYDAVAGVREFVVGTGGQSLQGFTKALPTSEVQVKRFGVLFLTLHARSYDWEFVADDGAVLDSGAGYCH